MRRKDILVKWADVKFYLHGEVNLLDAQDVFQIKPGISTQILTQAGYKSISSTIMHRKGRGKQRRK